MTSLCGVGEGWIGGRVECCPANRRWAWTDETVGGGEEKPVGGGY